jgi:hypothetical protein
MDAEAYSHVNGWLTMAQLKRRRLVYVVENTPTLRRSEGNRWLTVATSYRPDRLQASLRAENHE